MTLSNNYQPTKVSANGIIVDFGFTWNGLNTSYIKVYLEDKTTGDQTLVESTEYTFTAFNESGGNVRFNTAPADTNYVLIAREVSETQETPYKTSLGFNGEDVEASFDKLTGKVQELSETLDRTPTMPLGTETGAEFPVPVPGNLIQGNADGTGWEDAGVNSQDLVDDAESARQSAIAAAASETAAANSAVEASGYADDAEESATIAKESFKGDWDMDYVDPISGLPGYTQGNTVVFGANQWWSKTDENTSTPPLEYTTPSAEWEHYLRGAITDDQFIADVKEARLLGDGLETSFDLTAANATLRPTSKNQILSVFIDTEPVSEEEYIITIDGVTDHSLIVFNTAPDAPVDPNGTYNIIVKGATPKLAETVTENTIVTRDENIFEDYCRFGWKGTISSQAGALLESTTQINAYGAWSEGSPAFSNGVWSMAATTDKIGVALRKNTQPDDYDTLKFGGRFDRKTLTGRQGCFGFGYPALDNLGILIRIEESTGNKLKIFLSSNGSTWDITTDTDGVTSIPDNTQFDVDFQHDRIGTGILECRLSTDGLEWDDPSKVWTTEYTTTTALSLEYKQPNDITLVQFGGDQFDYVVSPDVYADYCYFEIDGNEYAKEELSSGFAFLESTDYHQYIGYAGTELVSEMCYNEDGSDLSVIDGDKQLVFSGKAYDNGLTYDDIIYYSQGNERYYEWLPNFLVHSSSSTVVATFDAIHGAPSNSDKIMEEYDLTGGYMNILISTTGLASSGIFPGNYRNVANSGQRQIGMWWVPNIFKIDTVIVNRDSYDSNTSYLRTRGHSIERGGRL